MSSSTVNPRFVLGMKLRRLRRNRELTLTALARQTGLSISYLSEIEKGKKYPKPEKLLVLASALDVPFDELVSLSVAADLSPMKTALASPFFKEFPFDLFGFDTADLFDLVDSDPVRAGALVHALVEVGQSYDLDMESFLLAALRAHQQMHSNYFEELEVAAAKQRQAHGWRPGEAVDPRALERILRAELGYDLDFESLGADPSLAGFRSVLRAGTPPMLLVNGDLMPSQRAFVLARELGYVTLGLTERALTSSWIEVESYDQVLNNFEASYFAGALLLDAGSVVEDVADLFQHEEWDPGRLAAAMRRFDSTPETYFTRLTQLVPRNFGLEKMYFVRMSFDRSGEVRLSKLLNTSDLSLPVGLGLGEHHCRRWPSFKLLGASELAETPNILAQRSHFLDADLEFLTISTLRPLALAPDRRSSVTIGWQLDDTARRTIGFRSDPAIERLEVNLTCERCGLTPETCTERVARPSVFERSTRLDDRKAALRSLLEAG